MFSEMTDNSSDKVSYTELELQRCFEIIQGNKKVRTDSLNPTCTPLTIARCPKQNASDALKFAPKTRLVRVSTLINASKHRL
jgi:hypothetical protein